MLAIVDAHESCTLDDDVGIMHMRTNKPGFLPTKMGWRNTLLDTGIIPLKAGWLVGMLSTLAYSSQTSATQRFHTLWYFILLMSPHAASLKSQPHMERLKQC